MTHQDHGFQNPWTWGTLHQSPTVCRFSNSFIPSLVREKLVHRVHIYLFVFPSPWLASPPSLWAGRLAWRYWCWLQKPAVFMITSRGSCKGRVPSYLLLCKVVGSGNWVSVLLVLLCGLWPRLKLSELGGETKAKNQVLPEISPPVHRASL